jgi:hypothetical protein
LDKKVYYIIQRYSRNTSRQLRKILMTNQGNLARIAGVKAQKTNPFVESRFSSLPKQIGMMWQHFCGIAGLMRVRKSRLTGINFYDLLSGQPKPIIQRQWANSIELSKT